MKRLIIVTLLFMSGAAQAEVFCGSLKQDNPPKLVIQNGDQFNLVSDNPAIMEKIRTLQTAQICADGKVVGDERQTLIVFSVKAQQE